MNKVLWTNNELPFSKFLNSFSSGLRADFVKLNPDIGEAVHAKPVLGQSELGLSSYLNYQEKLDTNGTADVTAWRALPVKYKRREVIDFTLPADKLARFPTAAKIVKHFGPKCSTAMYSLLAPHTTIKPHTDGEDLEREYVRVHIPLIVPDGECYFEINNTKVLWDNIWAFDTQEKHSAHNHTNAWRLVFILDLRRRDVGISC